MGTLIAPLLPRRERRMLAAFLAYFALLMPALPPFGAQPLAPLAAELADHPHAATIDPAKPHDHGGQHHAAPDATFLLPPGAGVLPDLERLDFSRAGLELSPTSGTILPVFGRHSPSQPRAPPAQA